MRRFIVNVLIVILYVLVGALLELLGVKSPAFYAFYGFVIGAAAMAANIYIGGQHE